eukprot:TRINITY_DN21276_c0_g1_i1.p1 TRINITY_DN21276_c0_g1~~TRINITY_DN21276_c0_g1_i1.p1  ORF type:complete len:840 (+),score=226.24 TRINITY_DN21276_c0_g1_i1:228-2747(+)
MEVPVARQSAMLPEMAPADLVAKVREEMLQLMLANAQALAAKCAESCAQQLWEASLQELRLATASTPSTSSSKQPSCAAAAPEVAAPARAAETPSAAEPEAAAISPSADARESTQRHEDVHGRDRVPSAPDSEGLLADLAAAEEAAASTGAASAADEAVVAAADAPAPAAAAEEAVAPAEPTADEGNDEDSGLLDAIAFAENSPSYSLLGLHLSKSMPSITLLPVCRLPGCARLIVAVPAGTIPPERASSRGPIFRIWDATLRARDAQRHSDVRADGAQVPITFLEAHIGILDHTWHVTPTSEEAPPGVCFDSEPLAADALAAVARERSGSTDLLAGTDRDAAASSRRLSETSLWSGAPGVLGEAAQDKAAENSEAALGPTIPVSAPNAGSADDDADLSPDPRFQLLPVLAPESPTSPELAPDPRFELLPSSAPESTPLAEPAPDSQLLPAPAPDAAPAPEPAADSALQLLPALAPESAPSPDVAPDSALLPASAPESTPSPELASDPRFELLPPDSPTSPALAPDPRFELLPAAPESVCSPEPGPDSALEPAQSAQSAEPAPDSAHELEPAPTKGLEASPATATESAPEPATESAPAAAPESGPATAPEADAARESAAELSPTSKLAPAEPVAGATDAKEDVFFELDDSDRDDVDVQRRKSSECVSCEPTTPQQHPEESLPFMGASPSLCDAAAAMAARTAALAEADAHAGSLARVAESDGDGDGDAEDAGEDPLSQEVRRLRIVLGNYAGELCRQGAAAGFSVEVDAAGVADVASAAVAVDAGAAGAESAGDALLAEVEAFKAWIDSTATLAARTLPPRYSDKGSDCSPLAEQAETW